MLSTEYQPLFSLYILNYNYSKYLGAAIESVMNQTFKDFEFYLIDDGSTDDSLKIIRSMQEKYSFELIEQENMGMMKSLNVALNRAKGKYLIRLDADDFLSNDSLHSFANLIYQQDYTYIFSAYNLADEEGNIISIEGVKENKSIKDQIPHGACMAISTESLRSIGGYNEKYSCQDGTIVWKKFHEENIAYIDKPLFFYRRHDSNMTLQKDKLNTEKELILLEG